MYYEYVFRNLEDQNIRYAVAGGVALVLHGVIRFTADLDLIVDLEVENLGRFVKVMQEMGYRPRNPVKAESLLDPTLREEWAREKGMVVFSFVHPSNAMQLIDVFILHEVPYEDIARELVRIKNKGVSIPVVSLLHLKILKAASGRPQDIMDIEALDALQSPEDTNK